MILHLFDNEKVIHRCVSLFEEALPQNNIFLVKVDNDSPLVGQGDNVILFSDIDELCSELFEGIDIVLIHYFMDWKIDVIQKYQLQSCKIVWAVWGGDMYNNLLEYLGYNIYYQPKSLGLRDYTVLSIGRFFTQRGLMTPQIRRQIKFIKKHVHLLLTIKEEFIIQKHYLGKNLTDCYSESPISIYYSIDDILGKDLINASVNGRIILIGNSCSFSNNHTYVFKYLAQLNLSNRKVVTPVSYGGNEKYKRRVIEEGKRFFGENYTALTSFLPLQEYNKLMCMSSICIFGSWRQEAMGNIVIAIYLGAKVFLSEKSPLYAFYRRIGLSIYCLETINQEELDIPLDAEERKKNREILFNLFNRNKIVREIQETFCH